MITVNKSITIDNVAGSATLTTRRVAELQHQVNNWRAGGGATSRDVNEICIILEEMKEKINEISVDKQEKTR